MRAMSLAVHPIIDKPLGGPSTPPGKSGYAALTRSEQAAMDLFRGFLEISHSHDTLLDLEVYGSRFPYGNTRITRSGHLRFVVEAYLQEVYTLAKRLEAYPRLISRRLAKQRADLDYQGQCERAEVLVAAALQGILKTRGAHVHQHRFSTPDLDNLDLHDFLGAHDDGSGVYRMLGVQTYRAARKKWLATIRSNNGEIEKLLDAYFAELYPLVFDIDGRARWNDVFPVPER